MFTLPKVIAHRGANQIAPENTLAAFEAAREHGANCIEFDVQLTQDQHLVVIHDDTIDRTSNGCGYIERMTLAALKALDAGSWLSNAYVGQRIPTFSEVITWLNHDKMMANIEIKASDNTSRNIETAQRAVELLLKQPLKNPVIFSSFCFETLKALRQALPDAPIAMLLSIDHWQTEFMDKKKQIEKVYRDCQCCALHLNNSSVTQEHLANCDFAEQIAVYTVNDTARAHELFNIGINSIFTDNVTLYAMA